MPQTDPKQFWENKILTWEEERYDQEKIKGATFLERIANRASNSLRFRIQLGAKLLSPFIHGKSILEVGCGSGLIADRFISAGATHYSGIDIAESAIAAANARKAEKGWQNIDFCVDTVMDMPQVKEDVVFSLGLLDWLNDAELEALFKKQGKADFLHAIAEKRFSLQQWLHRSYVQLSYGHRTGAYRPRYFTAREIAALAGKYRPGPFYVYRDPRLSFGAIISSFPIGEPIETK